MADAPIPLSDAQQRLAALLAPLPQESVSIDNALGRYLAAPLIARRAQPPADLSAMDGYALAGDGPSWQLVGESRAGHPYSSKLTSGEAVRISTGAVVPHGADRVLMQENARRDGADLSCTVPTPDPGTHIRRAGFDFDCGASLLSAGQAVSPATIALALTAGHASLDVHRKPRVVIIDGGDELTADPRDCAAHQIPASNGAMLAAMATPLCVEIARIGPVADTREALADAFEQAADADLVVTSGGASVGDHDLIGPTMEALGAKREFWRVAMKPGKPLMVARRRSQVLLGLPGNPVSAFVTGFLFMLPAIRMLMGSARPFPMATPLPLGSAMPAGGPRQEFRRAVWDGHALHPVAETDSSALRALASANALIDRPIDAPALAAGAHVPAYLLQNG